MPQLRSLPVYETPVDTSPAGSDDTMNNGIILLLILAAYFAVLLLIGRFSGGKSDDNSNFFLAGKSSPWWLVAIGMIGTSISGGNIHFGSRYALDHRNDLHADGPGLCRGLHSHSQNSAAPLLPPRPHLDIHLPRTPFRPLFPQDRCRFLFYLQDNRRSRTALSCGAYFAAHRPGRLEHYPFGPRLWRWCCSSALFPPSAVCARLCAPMPCRRFS